MHTKKRQNHKIYIEALRRMTSAERLQKAFGLSEFSQRLFVHGMRRRSPDLPEEAFRRIYLERLDICHNRNY